MTEATAYAKRFGIRFHDAIHFLFTDIFRKNLKIFIFPLRPIYGGYTAYYQCGKYKQGYTLFIKYIEMIYLQMTNDLITWLDGIKNKNNTID